MNYTLNIFDDQKILKKLDRVELSNKEMKRLAKELPKGISTFQARLIASVLSERFKVSGLAWATNKKNIQILLLVSKGIPGEFIDVISMKREGESFLGILQNVAKKK